METLTLRNKTIQITGGGTVDYIKRLPRKMKKDLKKKVHPYNWGGMSHVYMLKRPFNLQKTKTQMFGKLEPWEGVLCSYDGQALT